MSKNIYWLGNDEAQNVTLLYKPKSEGVWLSYVLPMIDRMPEPVWAGWYPNDSDFVKIAKTEKSAAGYHHVRDSGRYAIGFINAIFNDKDLRERLAKDFKGER